MSFHSPIHTKRLVLRPFTMDDIEAIYQMNLDPEVSRYTGDGGVKSREEMERIIKNNVLGDYKKHGFGRWAVEEKSSGKFIGFTGLKFMENIGEVDIGYRFIQSYWGKGIATESCWPALEFGFEEIQLDRIVGFVMPENTPSKRILQKLGFSYQHLTEMDDQTIEYYVLEKSNYQ